MQTDNVSIAFQDSEALDAFGALRVSNRTSEFESKLLGDSNPLLWDDVEVSGSGTTSTHNANGSYQTLAVSATTAGKRVRQAKQRSNFHPGHGQEIIYDFDFDGGVSGVTKEAGYSDDNDGLFLRLDGTTLSFVIKSNVTGTPVDTVIPQSAWELDKFDGTGPSDYTLDLTKIQVAFIDFSWPVGRIRFGFEIRGVLYEAHEIYTANVNSVPFMGKPDLPMRYSIENDGTGAATDMLAILSNVATEGGSLDTGQEHGISRDPGTALTTLSDTDFYPLMAFRHASGKGFVNFIPASISIVCSSTSVYDWQLLLNPTIAGTALSFSAVSGSFMEAQVNTTQATKVSAGTVLQAGTASDTNKTSGFQAQTKLPISIGETIAGVSDIIVLAVRRITGTTETFHGSMSWIEIR